jgi:hypothetical protein
MTTEGLTKNAGYGRASGLQLRAISDVAGDTKRGRPLTTARRTEHAADGVGSSALHLPKEAHNCLISKAQHVLLDTSEQAGVWSDNVTILADHACRCWCCNRWHCQRRLLMTPPRISSPALHSRMLDLPYSRHFLTKPQLLTRI